MKINRNYLEALVRSRLTFGCQVWSLYSHECKKLDSWYRQQLRLVIPGGMSRKGVHTNEENAECCSDSDDVSDEGADGGENGEGTVEEDVEDEYDYSFKINGTDMQLEWTT